MTIRSHSYAPRRRLAIEPLEGRVMLSAEMLTDLPAVTRDSAPQRFVSMNGDTYFTDVTTDGGAVWRTDGTTGGTSVVATFPPVSFVETGPTGLVSTGSRLFFTAGTAASGEELWVSDGTPAGTRLVTELAAGTATADPTSLTAVGNSVYFTANAGGKGRELWRSDGTAAGTAIVKDITVGSGSSSPGGLIAVGNRLFFSANAGSGSKLWASDGTDAGTIALNGQDSGVPDLLFQVVVGDVVYFRYTTAANGKELWKSDGTPAGTKIVRDLTPGAASSSPELLTAFNGSLYFRASGGAGGLWRTDGTEAGTVLVHPASAFGTADLSQVFAADGRMFIATGFTADGEVWATDGTPGGLTKVLGQKPTRMATLGGSLYFSAYNSLAGTELWRNDGTAAGTGLLADVDPGPGSSDPEPVAAANGRLYFRGNDPFGGRELFVTDGTSAGTRFVKDVNAKADPAAAPTNLTPLGDDLYFTYGRSLFKRVGATGAVDRISGLDTPAARVQLATLDGALYFSFDSQGAHPSLWKTGGTAAGVTPVHFGQPGANGGTISGLSAVDGRLFFNAPTQGAQRAHVSDGTPAGTTPLATAGSDGPLNARGFMTFGDDVFFIGSDAATGSELWATDGTPANTRRVKDVNPGTGNAGNGSPILEINGALLFTPRIGAATELWRSDGTPAGTQMLVDLDGTASASVQLDALNPSATLVEHDGFAYFFGNPGSGVGGLWRTDGTPGGTVRVATLPGGISGTNLTRVGGRLFFQTADALWVSDGTAAGTREVRPVAGITGRIADLDGVAYFAVSDFSVTGTELFRSDGTSAGTGIVADIRRGSGASFPANLLSTGGHLFFTASDGPHGHEIWQAAPGLPAPPTVRNVFVSGSAWTARYRNHLASIGVGESPFGYAVDVADQLNELPWVNVDTVSVRFSDDVVVDGDDLQAFGRTTATHALNATAFTYDAPTRTATWRFVAPLANPEKLRLVLSGVVGANGRALDGEWNNQLVPGASTGEAFPSGNGIAGGAFDFRMNVLPGDVNRSGGSVIGSDVTLVRNAQNFSPGSSGYSYLYDVNGSGSILGSDVTAVRNRQGFSLPSGEPGTAPAIVVAAATFASTSADVPAPRKRLADGLI